MQKFIAIGVLGKDPEIRVTPTGKKVATVSMATSEKYNGKDGQAREETEWHNLVAWDSAPGKGLASTFEKYLCKGAKIYIEGKIKTRQYDDKEGNKKYVTEIIVSSFDFCGGKKKDQDSVPNNQNSQTQGEPQDDDDLPF